MLTTNECLNIDDYTFKSSPESCSGKSCFTDSTDFLSDEDFLQQLSSGLDIPLLLNPGEDEMSLLNSFFDKSPEEIMSEIAFPSSPDDNASHSPKWNPYSNIKVEPDSCSSSGSNKSTSPVQSPDMAVKFFEIKDEMKSEPHSPGSTDVDTKLLISPCTSPTSKVVVLKSPDLKRPISVTTVSPPPPKVVVLENVATVPITTVAPISSLTTASITNCSLGLNVNNIDPRILKRQQRKIKNRESACLSRKKKKDYLTSLEGQVKELSIENQKLKQENRQLLERLQKYEGPQTAKSSSNIKTNIMLCMFLFSLALNLDYFKHPFTVKSQESVVETVPKVLDHHGRTLLWAPDEVLSTNNSLSMCPAAINQTENARLTSDLEKWIGKPKDSNNTSPATNTTKLATYKTKSLRKRRPKKIATSFISYGNRVMSHVDSNNQLQVFSPTSDHLYSEFFEAINRQDDTFYVVSFSDHHMLLPALHHNKTRRPKMSLIMPSVLPNENATTKSSFLPLMQIDCEVLDTRLIQVRYGSIPRHLRRDNETMNDDNADVSKQSDDPSNYSRKKAYKPYFIKRKSITDNVDDGDLYNIR